MGAPTRKGTRRQAACDPFDGMVAMRTTPDDHRADRGARYGTRRIEVQSLIGDIEAREETSQYEPADPDRATGERRRHARGRHLGPGCAGQAVFRHRGIDSSMSASAGRLPTFGRKRSCPRPAAVTGPPPRAGGHRDRGTLEVPCTAEYRLKLAAARSSEGDAPIRRSPRRHRAGSGTGHHPPPIESSASPGPNPLRPPLQQAAHRRRRGGFATCIERPTAAKGPQAVPGPGK